MAEPGCAGGGTECSSGSRRRPDLDADALATIGIDLDAIRARIEDAFGPGALSRRRCRRGVMAPGMPFTPHAKKALELALREAVALGDRHIGSEHVLLGLVREGDGVAWRILSARGVDGGAVHAALERDRPG
jgi:ATP-dependent Clp protease ATP-binding subunit ClpA